MADVLTVEKREKTGSAESRRLRRAGRIPAVLYGHGEENQHLTVPAVQVKTLMRHHSKTVTLEGDVSDTALVNEVHWDPLGIDVLHLDLIRVNLKEEVEVTVSVHTKGESVGVREGGVLLENLHEVDVRCPAGAIPESLNLDVSELGLGEHLTAGDLALPDGVTLVTDAEVVVAHVEKPRGPVEDEAAGDGTGAEPEVIAKGGEKEGEEDS